MTTPQQLPQHEEWVEYEVLGRRVRIRKSELEQEAAAFKAEDGTAVEKLTRRFGHLPGVVLEDAEPIDPSKLF